MRGGDTTLLFFSMIIVQALPQSPTCQCADKSKCHYVPRFMKSENTCSDVTLVSHRNKDTEIYCNGTLLDCGKLPVMSYSKVQIDELKVANCDVQTISCVLPALDASGVKTLNYSVSTPLTADALTGLDMLENLFLNGRKNTPAIVPTDAFKVLPNLLILRIEDFGLTAIPPFGFKSAPNLFLLDINLNDIKTIESDAFNGLKKLSTLELLKNNIEEIDANAFRGLESLKVLYLNENRVRTLPPGLFNDVPVQNITIVKNQGVLRLQTGALSGMKHLGKLIIQSDVVVLETGCISNLPNLTNVSIHNSSVQTLPEDVFENSTAIDHLNLSRNKLRSLPPSLFKSTAKLRILNLSHNHIEGVDHEVFRTLLHLNELYLNGNRIKVLYKKPFYSLSELNKLNVFSSNLNTVEDSVFPRTVTHLDLSENKLDWCPLDTNNKTTIKLLSPLRWLEGLNYLNLSNNNISDVCADWIEDMPLLMTLDLSYNNITILKNSDINFISHYIKVNFQGNPISTIKDLIYQNLTQTIQLGDNSFHCDCELYNFLKQSKFLGEPNCASPNTLNGCSLNTIVHGGSCRAKIVSLKDLTCPIKAPNDCKCIVRPALQRTECDCEKLPNTLPNPSENGKGISEMLLRLRLLENSKVNLPKFVTKLNLTGLQLSSVPTLPKHLRYVDLTNNDLTFVPLEFWKLNFSVSLSNNSLKCDCWHAEDVSNLQTFKTKIVDYYTTLRCSNGVYAHRLDETTLCYSEYVIGIVVLGVILIIILISIPLCYKYKLEIRIFLTKMGCKCWPDKIDAEDSKKKYDIFLSYVHKDEKFVKEKLLPKLDAKYKVCVHTRDWIPGEDILHQIYRSVAESRRTLIVLSNNYIKSGPWAQEEFRAAYLQTVKDGYPRCVVVLLGDVNIDEAPEHIKTYIKLHTYIQWEDLFFWERLYKAIPLVLTAKLIKRRWLAQMAFKVLGEGRSPQTIHEELGLINVPVLNTPESS